jgi:hypothetical protein
MKLKASKKGFSLSELSPIELSLITNILWHVDSRCYPSRDDENMCWYGGEDYTLTIDDNERAGLKELSDNLRQEVKLFLEK